MATRVKRTKPQQVSRGAGGDAGAKAGRGPARRWGRRVTLIGILGVALGIGGVSAAFHFLGASEHVGTVSGAGAGFNVLLVTLDTVRADHLGCYGYEAARTPNLDKLAGRGIKYEQAIAPAPITLPSHATMLTGLDVPSHGVRDNAAFHLADSYTTLAEVLAEHGYTTGAFIAAFILDKRYGLAQGFEAYDDDCTPPHTSARMPTDPGVNARSASDVTDSVLEWLRTTASGAKPFFAWLHYYDAHFPYVPPREYAQLFPDRPYDGEIAYVDAELGRVLEWLRSSRQMRRTLIVVAADHGESLGEHNEQTHGMQVYDVTMRVPLLLHNRMLFPKARVVDDQVVSLADIMPTVLDLLGIPAPAGLDGRSLLGPSDPDRAIYIETMSTRLNNGWAALHGLRRLHDKYILAPRPEYYDLRDDPHELHDLAAEEPGGMGELAERLAEVMAPMAPPDQVVAQASALSAEETERLASLGYVSGGITGTKPGVLDPKDMLPLWNRVMFASIKSQQGLHEQAIAEIQGVLQQDPTNAQAWYTAAGIYRRCDRIEPAEEALRRGLVLYPTAAAYVNLAQLLMARGVRQSELEATLAKAQQLDPAYGGTYMTRGEYLLAQGRTAEALASFEKALRVDPVNFSRQARKRIEWVNSHP
jgi:choline-sulfatase